MLASPAAEQRHRRYGFTKEWLRDNTWGKTRSRGQCSSSEASNSSDSTTSKGDVEESTNFRHPFGEPDDFQRPTHLRRDVASPSDIVREVPSVMLASRPANPKMPPPDARFGEDKEVKDEPLPPPPMPFDRTVSELPIPDSATSDKPTSPSILRHRSQSSASSQRPRRRLVWRGKVCWVTLPIEGDNGKSKPLTREEVVGRLRGWEAKGYNTAGFQLCADPAENSDYSHSRPVFPYLEDIERERLERAFSIRIPDQGEWEAYVEKLKEDKLRALGVTCGDEDTSTRNSPVPTFISRNASSQSSVFPSSPPPGVQSISGNGPHVNGFEISSMGASPPGSCISSAASPMVSQPGKAIVAHFPRYSMVMPTGSIQPPFTVSRTMSPAAGIAATNPPPLQNPSSRVASPAVDGRMQSLGAAMGSAVPSQRGLQQPNQQVPPVPAAMQIQETQPQMQCLQQQQRRREQLLPTYQTRPEHAVSNNHLEQMHRIRNQPELATPIPRGHRHNLSETLHREVEEAEKRRKQAAQLEEACRANKDYSTSIVQDELNADENGSQLKTSSGGEGTPMSKKHTGPTPGNRHRSTPSMSGLNANAPEFKSNPGALRTNNVFAFLGQQSQQTSAMSYDTSGYATAATSTKPRDPEPGQGLNVEAPAFVPLALQEPSLPSLPSREFSFSSSGPTFKPDAPAFVPQDSSVDLGKVEEKTIFGNINLENVIKNVRRSKAVPMVLPEDESSDVDRDVDGVEDELGRITQPEGRQKRARRKDDDGDEVPLFTAPPDLGQTFIGFGASYTRPDITMTPSPPVIHGSTNNANEGTGSEISPIRSSSAGKAEQAYAFKTPEDAAMFNAAHPRSPTSSSPAAAAPQERRSNSTVAEGVADEPAVTGSSLRDIADISKITPAQVLSNAFDKEFEQLIDGVTYIEPSYNEIDAVMKHLNGEDSDIGIERNYNNSKPAMTSIPASESSTPVSSPPGPFSKQSHASSPSPKRLKQRQIPNASSTDSESADTTDMHTALVAENGRFSPSYRPSMTDLAAEALVHKLNSPEDAAISDWDDAISSSEELKFQTRSGFFARHVDDLVGNVVQQRLSPLENTLAGIQEYLATISSRSESRKAQRSTSTGEVELSDADDEDDGANESYQSRLKSPLHIRKADKLKASIREIDTAQQVAASATQVAEIMSIVQELKKAAEESDNSATNIKSVVEDAVGRQLRGRSQPVTSSQQSASAEKSQLQIAGLESMLKIAESRAEDELKARRSTEDALADNQRLLRSAMHEAAEHREAAEETERGLEHLHEERHEMLRRNAVLEGSQETLESTVSTQNDKIEALEATLDEYRLSGTKWRGEIEETKAENKILRKTIDTLRFEMEESVVGREAIKSKFERLRDDMVSTTRDIAKDQTAWRTKEVEYEAKVELLGARLEAEAKTQDRLEREIEKLESQEIEAMKARYLVEQTQKANADLEAQVLHLRNKCEEHLDKATAYARDLHEAQESGKLKLARLRQTLESDIDAAESKARNVLAEHESANARLQAQIQQVNSEFDASRARYEALLKDTTDRSRTILQEAIEAKNLSTKEQISSYERSHQDLKAQHERELTNAMGDKQRLESQFMERLQLADEKNKHYTDKVVHLEEMLSIARSAAQAAAKASRQQQKPQKTVDSPLTSPASISTRGISSIPDKISPQALRESILVLQEQLQQRESHIEQLEHSLAELDTNAPRRVKDQEVEILWLRELLGVRLDDLQDIINILAEPNFEHDAVRDAVIRLRANLQMEQQEKERAMSGQSSFPGLSNITSLASSPRALPMAAAAAWGNWRKASNTSSFGSLSAIANNTHAASQHQRTPSRPAPPTSSSQNFLSGLLTPPNTTTSQTSRRTFSSPSVKRPGSSAHQQGPQTPRQSLPSKFAKDKKVIPYSEQNPPVTPTLMRNSSYDQDAESTDLGAMSATESTHVTTTDDDGPFGPTIDASTAEQVPRAIE